jgi:hypothetical protein
MGSHSVEYGHGIGANGSHRVGVAFVKGINVLLHG